MAQDRGDYDLAMTTLDEREFVCRDGLKNPTALAWTLLQQAYLFAVPLGQKRYAMLRLEEARAAAGPDAPEPLARRMHALEASISGRI